jgi:hypothetical protein
MADPGEYVCPDPAAHDRACDGSGVLDCDCDCEGCEECETALDGEVLEDIEAFEEECDCDDESG